MIIFIIYQLINKYIYSCKNDIQHIKIFNLFSGTSGDACGSGQFQCELTKQCIPMGWRCDGDVDCGRSDRFGEDTSDEDPLKCKRVKNHFNISQANKFITFYSIFCYYP